MVEPGLLHLRLLIVRFVLVSFCCHFGVLRHPFGHLGPPSGIESLFDTHVYQFFVIWGIPWKPLGTPNGLHWDLRIWTTFWTTFSTTCFFFVFSSLFGIVLVPFLYRFGVLRHPFGHLGPPRGIEQLFEFIFIDLL